MAESKNECCARVELPTLKNPKYHSDFVSMIECCFNKLFQIIQELPSNVTEFHSSENPTPKIGCYSRRLIEHLNCSVESCVIALVHINRLKSFPNFPIDSLNIHRLLLTSLVCSSKYFEDVPIGNNACWARIGGISLKEMNHLERSFLKRIDYRMFVDEEEYFYIYDQI